jgi:hypothetical protein
MIKKLLLLNCALLIARLACWAQKVLMGKVPDDTGNALPGVSFLLTRTSIGILSDANGGYSLFFPQPVPVSSFIAFEQQGLRVGVQRIHFDLMKINYGHFNY